MTTNQSQRQLAAPPKRQFLRIVPGTVAQVATGVLVLSALSAPLLAASINIPNGSFELPATTFVDINVASWQKAPKPAYFDEASSGFLWIQTAGVFLDSNPYANHDGTQAAYMMSFPQAALFQDLASPDAIYEAGTSYSLTLGVFGKGTVDGATLALSLFYRDSLNNMVTVGSPTTITYSAASFPNVSPLNLFDYTVSTPVVQAGDPWAGKGIGIKIEATTGIGAVNWDMDNARLVATPVPEPATWSLLALGLGGWLLVRSRRA